MKMKLNKIRFSKILFILIIIFAFCTLLMLNPVESSLTKSKNKFLIKLKTQNIIRNTNNMKALSAKFLESLFKSSNLLHSHNEITNTLLNLERNNRFNSKSLASKLRKSETQMKNKIQNQKMNKALMKNKKRFYKSQKTTKISDVNLIKNKVLLMRKLKEDQKLEKMSNKKRKLELLETDEMFNLKDEKFIDYRYYDFHEIKKAIFKYAKVEKGKWVKVTTAQKEFGLPYPGGNCSKTPGKYE